MLLVKGSGCTHSTRVFNDKLGVIKRALNKFYVRNKGLLPGERVGVKFALLHVRAIMVNKDIVERHHMAVEERTMQQQQQEVEGAARWHGKASDVAPSQEAEGVVASRDQKGDGVVAHLLEAEGTVTQYGRVVEGVFAQKGEAGGCCHSA